MTSCPIGQSLFPKSELDGRSRFAASQVMLGILRYFKELNALSGVVFRFPSTVSTHLNSAGSAA